MHSLFKILIDNGSDFRLVGYLFFVISIAVKTFNDFIDIGEIVLELDLTVDLVIFVFPAAVSKELVIHGCS